MLEKIAKMATEAEIDSYLDRLNINIAQTLLGNIEAAHHWLEKKPKLYSDYTQTHWLNISYAQSRLTLMIEGNLFEHELTDYGAEIIRENAFFCDSASHYQTLFLNQDWEWIGGDGQYTGCWFNKEKSEIVSYTEGDITKLKCPTPTVLMLERKMQHHFYQHCA